MRHGIEHPVVNDAGFRVWDLYAVHAWPTVVLVDATGIIAAQQSGEISAADVAPIIEELIAEAEQHGILDRTPLDARPESATELERLLRYPAGLVATSDGRLFLADTGHHRVLEVALDGDGAGGEVLRVFGNGEPGLRDGSPQAAAFHSPHGLAITGQTLYVADTENHAIRAVDLPTGEVRTLAGTGGKGVGRYIPGTPPAKTALRSPWGLLAIESVLFIAMAGSHQIWVLVEERELGVFAGTGAEALVDGPRTEASFNQPSGLTETMGHILVADSEASAIRAISLDDQPRVITLVGQGLFEFGDVDGVGPEVRLQHAMGIAADERDTYIADTYNHKIKRLDPTTGRVETVIGTGEPGDADGPFDRAQLYEPEALALATRPKQAAVPAALMFIADTNNHVLRVADLAARTLKTVALRERGNDRDRLQAEGESRSGSPASRNQRRLEPVTLGPGKATVKLDIQLPAGYKLNDETPPTLAVEGTDEMEEFPDGRMPQLTVEGTERQDLPLELTLYYCRRGDEGLCLIHRAHLLLPLQVTPGGPVEVTVPYVVAG